MVAETRQTNDTSLMPMDSSSWREHLRVCSTKVVSGKPNDKTAHASTLIEAYYVDVGLFYERHLMRKKRKKIDDKKLPPSSDDEEDDDNDEEGQEKNLKKLKVITKNESVVETVAVTIRGTSISRG